jgi:membrane associated rhomboid family serine protease
VIPLYDTVPARRRPVLTVALIAINIVVFLVEIGAPDQHLRATNGHTFDVTGQTAIVGAYGFVPCELGSTCPLGNDTQDVGARAPVRYWHVPVALTILTSMFLHGGWAHIGFNMLFLWIFGNNIEDRLGRPRFLLFYLLGGVCAALVQWLADRGSDIPTIGASGAIAAVLGGYLLLFPRAFVITLVGWIPLPIPAVAFLLIWIGLQALGAAAGFHALSGGGGGVAYFAHLGGFAFGMLTVRALDQGPGPPRARAP